MPIRELPPLRNLRDFPDHLAMTGDLAFIAEPVSLVHEITQIHRRTFATGGPTLCFDHIC